jgi:hypothetical protein
MGTVASYTTKDGYVLRVFDSMYVDWGLEIIDPNGDEAYYSPSALSIEAYGLKPDNDEMDYEEAENQDRLIPFDEHDWIRCLADEAWDLIEAFCPDE